MTESILVDSVDSELQQTQLICNPSMSIVRCSADEVMVRVGSRSRVSKRIQDKARRGLLAAVVEHFAVPQAITTLPIACPTTPGEDLDEVMGQLIEQKVLIDVADAELTLLTLGLSPATGSYGDRTVSLVGSGRLAQAVANQLADVGVGRLVIVTEDAAACRQWGPAEGPTQLDILEGHWSEGALLADAFDDTDVVVIPADSPDLSLFYASNSAALEARIPWHIAYVDGLELILGPLFRPFDTACFNDFDTQEEAGRSLLMEHVFYKSQLLKNGLANRRLPRLVTDLGASIVTLSVLQQLSGQLSFLDGSLLRVDLERLEVIKEPVLRLARCPACVQGVADLRHPFL